MRRLNFDKQNAQMVELPPLTEAATGSERWLLAPSAEQRAMPFALPEAAETERGLQTI